MQLTRHYPVKTVCQLLGVSRSSYYYQAQDRPAMTLRDDLLRLAEQWPTYGYRRLTAQLRREGQVVNGKLVRWLLQELGLQHHKPRRKQHTTNSQHHFNRYPNHVQGLTVSQPDQVWVADITYIHLREEFVYLAILMDVFTRSIRGWWLGRGLDQELTLMPLRQALRQGQPQIHHSDQGLQYAATAYVDLLQEHQVTISMAEVGAAWQNGYAERLMRTIKEEEVDLSDYRDYAEAQQQLGRFLDEVYMRKRIHSALGYLTPAEFESQWLAQQKEPPVT